MPFSAGANLYPVLCVLTASCRVRSPTWTGSSSCHFLLMLTYIYPVLCVLTASCWVRSPTWTGSSSYQFLLMQTYTLCCVSLQQAARSGHLLGLGHDHYHHPVLHLHDAGDTAREDGGETNPSGRKLRVKRRDAYCMYQKFSNGPNLG